MHAIRVHETGGPEVLRWEEYEPGEPGADEVLIRQRAIGVNFIDIYFRNGLYQPPSLPFTPGMEGAGLIEAVGSEVQDLAPGDRVAYAAGPPGAYAERRILKADRAIRLPPAISEEQAAAMMLKGMTAQYLLRRTYRLRAGETILVHAAAGGVGLILCQWAKHLGATVIGTVGSREKAALARAHGCDHPILYREEGFVERVHEITRGNGVAVVYDSVGKETFEKSLDCLQPLGMLVSFGQSSGSVQSFDPGLLAKKGSLFLTRPVLFAYTTKRQDLLASAQDLFDVIGSAAVKIEIHQRFPLKDAAEAQRALEGRRTTGSTILLP